MPNPTPKSNESQDRSHLFRWMFAIGTVVILSFAFYLTHSASNPPEAQSGHGKKRPVPVILTPVTTQTVPVELKTIGNVESISSVTIKPQSDGIITNIRFKEGDHVQ